MKFKTSERDRLPLLSNDTDNTYDRDAKLHFHEQTLCVMLFQYNILCIVASIVTIFNTPFLKLLIL